MRKRLRTGVTQTSSLYCDFIDKCGGAGQFEQRADVTEEAVDDTGATEGEKISRSVWE